MAVSVVKRPGWRGLDAGMARARGLPSSVDSAASSSGSPARTVRSAPPSIASVGAWLSGSSGVVPAPPPAP